MTRTPSPSDLLTQHAPEHVSDRDLDAILWRVQATASDQRRPRRGIRRVAVGGLVAAATVAAAVLLPAALKAPDGAATALEQLATTAATQPATVVPKGSYLHLVTVETAEESPGEPDRYPRTLRSWVASDGEFWRHDTANDGSQEWFRVVPGYSSGPEPVPAAFDTSPQALAKLPTDTQALLEHLRSIVMNSSSTDEAVFVFLGDALRAGYAPAETQRAMIAAMARLPHIETERTQASDGRACLKVSYSEPSRKGLTQAVCFDEATAALIEEELISDGELSFRSTITTREVVTEVPAEVVAKAGDPACDDDCQAASGVEPVPVN